MTSKQMSQSRTIQKNVSQFKQFIQSNKQYLKQKYYEIFHDSDTTSTHKIKLTAIPTENVLSYLYQIFSLEKYSANKKVSEVIRSSVQENIKQYLMELDPSAITQNNQLNFQKLLELLVFIISRNGIFAIQYETKSKYLKQANLKQNRSNKSLNVQIDISQNIQENENQIIDDQDYNSSKLMSSKNKSKVLNSYNNQNQFDIAGSLQSANSQHLSQRMFKKNAKVLFDFYCRQQMELGGVITFDRLNEQTSSMSLGKCLTFAKATHLYNNLIKRQDLVSKFKKVSQGKKYIDFEKFQAMIGEFQVMDPNFNQRIGLLSEDIRKVLKYVKLPFNTKDINPRQNIAIRNFSSKLTGHSGQTSESLKVQLQEKKQQTLNIRKIQQIRQYLKWKESRPELIKQKDLKSPKISRQKDLTVQLSFIGSIIHPEQDDSTYLKDHLIPKLERPTQKIPKFGKVFQTQRYQSLDKLTLRKQSVVSDIRKRIKQIQSSENLDFEKKMKLNQISGIKNRYSHK